MSKLTWEDIGRAVRGLMDSGKCPHIPENLDMLKLGVCEYCRNYQIQKLNSYRELTPDEMCDFFD